MANLDTKPRSFCAWSLLPIGQGSDAAIDPRKEALNSQNRSRRMKLLSRQVTAPAADPLRGAALLVDWRDVARSSSRPIPSRRISSSSGSLSVGARSTDQFFLSGLDFDHGRKVESTQLETNGLHDVAACGALPKRQSMAINNSHVSALVLFPRASVAGARPLPRRLCPSTNVRMR